MNRKYGIDLKAKMIIAKLFVENPNLFYEASPYTLLTKCGSNACFFCIITHRVTIETILDFQFFRTLEGGTFTVLVWPDLVVYPLLLVVAAETPPASQ